MSATVIVGIDIAHIDDNLNWTVPSNAVLEARLQEGFGGQERLDAWQLIRPQHYIPHDPAFLAEQVVRIFRGRMVEVNAPPIDPEVVY